MSENYRTDTGHQGDKGGHDSPRMIQYLMMT